MIHTAAASYDTTAVCFEVRNTLHRVFAGSSQGRIVSVAVQVIHASLLSVCIRKDLQRTALVYIHMCNKIILAHCCRLI